MDPRCVLPPVPGPFLALPAEIRIKVYDSICLPPLAGCHEYTGLFLSCRQIKHEIEYEALKTMTKYIENFKEHWASWPCFTSVPLHLSVPTSFKDITNLTIQLPASTIEDISALYTLLKALLPLLKLSLAHFEIQFDAGDPGISVDTEDWAYDAPFIHEIRCFLAQVGKQAPYRINIEKLTVSWNHPASPPKGLRSVTSKCMLGNRVPVEISRLVNQKSLLIHRVTFSSPTRFHRIEQRNQVRGCWAVMFEEIYGADETRTRGPLKWH